MVIVLLAVVGCSKRAQSPPTSAKVRLTVTTAAPIESFKYRVLRSDRPEPLAVGRVTVGDGKTSGEVEMVVPAGQGNMAEVMAASRDSRQFVGSSAAFDVAAGHDMTVAIQLEDQAAMCEACEKAPHLEGIARHTCALQLLGTLGTWKNFGCDKFAGAARDACKALRSCIVGKHCARGSDSVACYCGDRDRDTCVAKGAPKDAPCYKEYEAAALVGKPGKVEDLFVDPASPVGIANNLFRCDVDAQCPCGQ